MASAGCSIISGDYSFSELTLELYVTQVTPLLSWIETVLVALLGDLGRAILSIPIFIISPMKFVAGVLIGWWAYTTLKTMPSEHAQQ